MARTRVLRFHGFGGPIRLVVDDRSTGEVHFVRLFVDSRDFDRTVRAAVAHDSEIELLGEACDVTVHGADVDLVGTRGLHKVYVVGGSVSVVGDDAPARAVETLLARLEKAMLSGRGPAWWTDFRLVASISLSQARKGRV
jgi:hypothetical protein